MLTKIKKIACLCPPLIGHATPMTVLLELLHNKGYEILFFDFFESNLPFNHSFRTIKIPNNFSKNIKSHQIAYKQMKELIEPLSDFFLSTYPIVKKEVAQFKPDLLLIDHYYPIGEAIALELNIKYIFCYSSPDVFLIDRDNNDMQSKLNLLSEQKKYQYYENFMISKTKLSIKSYPFSKLNNICFAPKELIEWNVNAFKNGKFISPYNNESYPLQFIGSAALYKEPTTVDLQLKERIKNYSGFKIYVSFGTVWTRLINTEDISEKLILTIRNILQAFNGKNYTIVYIGDQSIIKAAVATVSDLECNLISENHVNQAYLLDIFDLVIFHGGFNTFIESINAKVPMIGIPMGWDQGRITNLLTKFKIGERISFLNNTSEEIKEKAKSLAANTTLKKRLNNLRLKTIKAMDINFISDEKRI